MIQMIGMDHTSAPVDVRSVFAFRKSEIPDLMAELRRRLDAAGIVLLSTCNRMEIWVSSKKPIPCILEHLCALRGLQAGKYRACFTQRTDADAAKHLFELTAGLKSAIVAEDQILTQVKEAADLARLNHLSDSPLEVLFRSAVATAKRVKTEVVFHRGNATAIEKAIALVERRYFSLQGRKVLVIGNGEYGRLAAERLLAAGADVTVTIRQYHSGEVRIPEGAKAILYGDKYQILPDCHLVVSATASPNYTIFRDKLEDRSRRSTMVLIDLAVPRDIEPSIRELPGYELYDIDDFRSELGKENTEALEKAGAIIEEGLEDFHTWISFRDIIPLIDAIREASVKDISSRLEKPLRRLPISQEEKDALKVGIEDASGKVVANLFYHLRDTLDEESFRACLRAAGMFTGA